jgi:predicted MFS family arabinose efflux permease
MVSMFLFGGALGLFNGVFNNYLAEVLLIDRFERGVVEFLRELPGFLLFLLLIPFYRSSETRIIQAAFLISLAGLAGLAGKSDLRYLSIFFVVLWSTGEHMIMPLRQSIAMHSAKPGREGFALGLSAGAKNFGQVTGYYLVPLCFIAGIRLLRIQQSMIFRLVFFLSAFFIVLSLISTLWLEKSDKKIKRQKIYFHKKFMKFYILQTFFGARKQVFLTFAPYVLILKYGARTELIAMLYGIYSTLNIFFNPLVGKFIDRFGYKKILIVDSIVLFSVCIIYGFSHLFFSTTTAFLIICVVFVIDAMLFAVSMARTVYVGSLSDSREEASATISTGISLDHLFSIIIALLGGLLWEKIGMELLFSVAAFFAVGSFFFSLSLEKPAGKR